MKALSWDTCLCHSLKRQALRAISGYITTEFPLCRFHTEIPSLRSHTYSKDSGGGDGGATASLHSYQLNFTKQIGLRHIRIYQVITWHP